MMPPPSADGGAPATDAGVPLTVGSCGVAPPAPSTGVCRTTAGMTWCWENPMPSGEAISALGGTSADDVWALTDTMVLHGVNGQWVDTIDGFFGGGAFYAASAAEVWLATGFQPAVSTPPPAGALYEYVPPSIWHWDGRSWSVVYRLDFVPNQTLRMTGIWGSSRRDIWATADGLYGASLIHFDGTSWSPVTESALTSSAFEKVWGSAPNDVWAIGRSATSLYHFDGKSWAAIASPPGDPLNTATSGTGAGDVWVGEADGMAHFDGVGWTSYPLGPQVQWQPPLMPVALAPSDAWALASWTAYPDPNCTVAHWDGGAWTIGSVAAELDSSDCYVTATGWRQGGLVAGGERGRLDVLTCSGQFQSMVGRATSAELDAIWGAANDDLWAVGKHGTVLHGSGGGAWVPAPVPTTAALSAIWGASANDVWAVGAAGTAIHWNGSRWTAWPTGTANDLSAISGSSGDNVWAVSARSSPEVVIRFDGTSWSVVKRSADEFFSDVAAVAPDDVWITGSSGFLHWNGSAFDLVPPPGPSDAPPSGIKAYARDDIWADSGMRWVFHYDGATWTVITAGGEPHPGRTAGYGPFITKIAGDANGPPYFLMQGEIIPVGNVARIDASGALAPLPKLYVSTKHNGLFVLGREAWLVGDGGAIEHGFLPLE